MLRIHRLLALVSCLAVISMVSASPRAAETSGTDRNSLSGTWRGKVTADIGEMVIELTVTADGARASGAVKTAHGTFPIRNGKLVDGVWTLPFDAGDGVTGSLTGRVTADVFRGDWDFRPMAVGKFDVRRQPER